jgi:WD40 repeat protein
MLYERSTWRDALTGELFRRVLLALLALFGFAAIGGFIQTKIQHRAWDAVTDDLLPYDLRYSPDFSLMASATLGGGVYLWNASDKTLLNKLGDEGIATQLAFAPGYPDFAWSFQSYAFFYSRSDGRMVQTPIRAKSWIYSLAISPNQFAVVATGSSAVELWNTGLPDDLHHIASDFGSDAAVQVLAFSDDTGLLAAGLSDGRVLTWRVDASKLAQEFKTEQIFARSVYSDPAQQLVFSPDKQMLAVGRDASVVLLSVSDGAKLREFQIPGYIYRFAFSPDSKLLVVAHANTNLRPSSTRAPSAMSAWRTDTGELAWTSEQLPSPVVDLRVSQDNRTITAGHYDGEVRTYKMP